MVWLIREGFWTKFPGLARDPSTAIVKSKNFPQDLLSRVEKKVSEKAGGTPLESTKLLNEIDWFRKPSTVDRGKNASKRISSLATRWWRRLVGMLIHDATSTCMAWQQAILLINEIAYINFYTLHVWISRATLGCVGPVAMTHRPML